MARAALKIVKEEIPEEGLIPYSRRAYKIFGDYSLEQRAVTDYRDGLKPVQRRLVWAAYQLGLTASRGVVKKSARIVGDCFTAGTKISTPSGPRSIETLTIGDEVLTSRGTSVVTNLFSNQGSSIYQLSLNNGVQVDTTFNQEVKIKVGDKFFWKKVSELTPDDQIVIERA